MSRQVFLVLFCSVALPTDHGRDGEMVLSGTCSLVICVLLGMTWHVSPDWLGVTHTPLWLVANITYRLLSALYAIAIGILLALVMRLGTSVRRRGLEQSWIRIELYERRTRHCHGSDRWFGSAGRIAVHCCNNSPSVSISVTASHLRQVDSTAAGLGCCQAHCELCGRCFKRRGFGRHRCSGACPRPTVQARQYFQYVYQGVFIYLYLSLSLSLSLSFSLSLQPLPGIT